MSDEKQNPNPYLLMAGRAAAVGEAAVRMQTAVHRAMMFERLPLQIAEAMSEALGFTAAGLDELAERVLVQIRDPSAKGGGQ